MALFNRVTIVGLGLIGGSLGMAIRRKRLAREVVGLSRTAATVTQAKRKGAIDWGTTDAHRAVHEAELAILATPVSRIAPYARHLARLMPRGSIITDVGSSKAQIIRQLEQTLPRQIAFVGGHPLAGSEHRGLHAADGRLFEQAVVILTPTPRTNARALRRVRALWRRLAGKVVTISPERHDRLLADVSHLPHALACCLVAAVTRSSSFGPPRSFLEMTRIAKSDPSLWDGIFLSNRTALLHAMDGFDQHWRALRREVQAGRQAALHRRLSLAKSKREQLDHA